MDREKLRDELKRDEGLRLVAYYCTTGHRTIGFGHVIDQEPKIKECTREQANEWLELDIDIATRVAENYLWPDRLKMFPESVQRAITNMAFNMGHRLYGFKKLRKALLVGNFHQAADEVRNSLYCKQVGDRAERVARMMENGDA